MPKLVDTCGNCFGGIYEGKSVLYDDRAEIHFCDEQCFREWAENDGVEKVISFYHSMNVTGVTY
jgi:hypothetical protein